MSSFLNKESDTNKDYEKYVKYTLNESYYMVCLKTCIKDYSTPLDRYILWKF
jgi:hypothetical protein